jgi:hypothetical protein
MAEPRRAQTTKIGGGADYAKVAERLKLFREDNKHGKHESAYEVEVDGGLVFTVWLWKDKADLIDLIKAGVTDKDTLRSSADANGNSKGAVGTKEKDFEKLETIALGRALANLGYLASGEIASVEEMEEFERFKQEQHMKVVQAAIGTFAKAKTLDELKKLFVESKLMNDSRVVAAKDTRKAEIQKEQAQSKQEPTDANNKG